MKGLWQTSRNAFAEVAFVDQDQINVEAWDAYRK